MKAWDNFIWRTVILLTILIGIGTTVRLASAQDQLCIAQGTELESATFSIYVGSSSNSPTVNLHRINSAWNELTVTWNNFGASYDAEVLGSFITNGAGWHSVIVTSLVQTWVDGALNFGVLLEQGQTDYTEYYSSDNSSPTVRPKLEICFAVDDCITIQRPDGPPDGVVDSYIWERPPDDDANFGSAEVLYTGLVGGYEKQSLVYFDIDTCPGTGTPGYWKNHPDAWPWELVSFCDGPAYEAIDVMWMKSKGDKSYDMFNHLVSALLNVAIGNPDECIAQTISEASAWMCDHLPGSGVKGNSEEWEDAEPLKNMLDDYNNGYLCVPHRE